MGIDGVSIRDFKRREATFIEKISNELCDGNYTFDAIKCSLRRKLNGKHRKISEPTVRDRVVHRAIHKVINPILFPYINTDVSYCGVKKDVDEDDETPNIKSAIEKLVEHVKRKNYWIFESDIKGFFDNVPKQRMFDEIIGLLPDSSINGLIRQIIYYRIGNEEDILRKGLELPNGVDGIAQGSSLSPLFANLYLGDFDRGMKAQYGDRFIRYVDDFIVVTATKKEAEEAQTLASKILNSKGLSLSDEADKTRMDNLKQNGYIKFLGLRIDKNKIQPKKSIRQLIDWLTNNVLKKKDRHGKPRYQVRFIQDKNGTIVQKVSVIEQMNEIIRGWGNFYRFYHSANHFKEIDLFFNEYAKQNHDFKSLFLLQKLKYEPVVSEANWQSYF